MGFDFASILVAYGTGALPTLPAGGVRPPQQPKASQMTSLDLTGRTAIITGASRGIGLAIAQQLAAAGAHVVLTARRQEAADEALHRSATAPWALVHTRSTRMPPGVVWTSPSSASAALTS